MPAAKVGLAPGRLTRRSGLATLDAMAQLARQTGSVVHVVLAREPGTVEHARAVAQAVGVDVSVDLMAHSLRVRFSRPTT